MCNIIKKTESTCLNSLLCDIIKKRASTYLNSFNCDNIKKTSSTCLNSLNCDIIKRHTCIFQIAIVILLKDSWYVSEFALL